MSKQLLSPVLREHLSTREVMDTGEGFFSKVSELKELPVDYELDDIGIDEGEG